MVRRVLGRLRVPSLPTAISLLALSIVVTGTAWAATGQLVNIADGSNAARVAKVSQYGNLQVGDGSGPMTVDGTVKSREATPRDFINFYEGIVSRCDVLVTAPSTRGVVITDMAVDTEQTPTSENSYTTFGIASASDCLFSGVQFFHFLPRGTTQIDLGPGIVIPPGYRLIAGRTDSSWAGSMSGYGYTVPASEVPAAPITPAKNSTERAFATG